MSFRIRDFLVGVLVPSALLAASASARAASCKWIGPDGGAWNNPSNWSTKTVPGASDDVIIDGKKKVSVPLDATVANLVVGSGAEIKNGGKIKVLGTTASAGLFTGKGILDIPEGASAVYSVDSNNLLATVTGTNTPVVFAPINNKGKIVTKVASGCRVDFASIQNDGATQIVSDGTVTFKDIKNNQDISIAASGTLTLAKIDNSGGASCSISALPTSNSLGAGIGSAVSTLLGSKSTQGITSNSSIIRLDDLTNHIGGKVKLSGPKEGRYFNGKSIVNQGEMQISGAQTLLEADVTNEAGATLTLDSDATLFPSDNSAPKLNNAGTLIKTAGSDATLKVDWANTGQVIVEDGTLHVRVPSGKSCKQTAGVTSVEGGTLSIEDASGMANAGTFEVAGGVVNGIGTITGNVVNSGGRFKPGHSPGTITINGNYTQTNDGILDMEVGGTTPGSGYDQMVVNGTAYLAGTINMTRWNGFSPANGDIYTLLTYYSKSGNFSKFVDATPVAGITYDTTLTPTDLELNCYGTPDTTAPSVSISSPTNGGAVRSLTSATGKASDAVGVSKVTCRLYRYANSVTGVAAGYWAGGTTWTSTASSSNDRSASGTTSWTFSLPTMVAGRYSLFSTATDAAGNSASSSTISFYVDPNSPSTLTIGTPANNATISSLSQISGTASDAADGSGVTSVQYQIKRSSDSTYWNGSAWTTTATSFTASLSGTNWSRTANLPTGTALPAGKYSVVAVATDKAGNTKSLNSLFTVGTSTSSAKTS